MQYQNYMPDLLSALQNKAQTDIQAQKEAADRARTEQLNPMGMLAGLITGAAKSGMLDNLGKVDWGNLIGGGTATKETTAPLSADVAKSLTGIRSGAEAGYKPVDTELGQRFVPEATQVPVTASSTKQTPTGKGADILGVLGDAFKKTDWSKLGSEKALLGAGMGGTTQNTGDVGRNILTGGVAGLKSAEEIDKAEAENLKAGLEAIKTRSDISNAEKKQKMEELHNEYENRHWQRMDANQNDLIGTKTDVQDATYLAKQEALAEALFPGGKAAFDYAPPEQKQFYMNKAADSLKRGRRIDITPPDPETYTVNGKTYDVATLKKAGKLDQFKKENGIK